jgi:hypothetical protein
VARIHLPAGEKSVAFPLGKTAAYLYASRLGARGDDEKDLLKVDISVRPMAPSDKPVILQYGFGH